MSEMYFEWSWLGESKQGKPLCIDNIRVDNIIVASPGLSRCHRLAQLLINVNQVSDTLYSPYKWCASHTYLEMPNNIYIYIKWKKKKKIDVQIIKVDLHAL